MEIDESALVSTFVIYDIVDDAVRNRVAEVCKDFGLERVQYSSFLGELSAPERDRLLAELTRALGGQAGKIWIQPVCRRDLELGRRIEVDRE